MTFDNLLGYILSIYQCVCKISSQYSTQFKRWGHFHFFRIWSSAKPRMMKNDILQSLGLDLDNINVYAEVYQNIPLSSRDKAIFTFQNLALGKASTDDKCHFAIVSLFSEFEPRQKLNQSQMSFDNLMGYILLISMCMKFSSQNSIQFKR